MHRYFSRPFFKSLLTSLYQREEIPLFGKEGIGEILRWFMNRYQTTARQDVQEMRRRPIPAALSSAFGILLLLPALCSAESQMVIKPQIHDFKSVLQGDILTHTFEVFNQGDEDLIVERVKPECTCSVVHFDPLIPPNGQGKIIVEIDTRGFEGPERWVAKVFSNDPKWKEAVLDLRANVKPVITLSGSPVFFSGKKNASVTGEVEISTELDRPLTLTPEQFTLSGKVIYSLSEIEKGKRYQVIFQNVASKGENYRGYLKLKTNFPEKPDVTIWIIGRLDL